MCPCVKAKNQNIPPKISHISIGMRKARAKISNISVFMLMPFCFLSISKVALYSIPIVYRTVGSSELFVGIEGGIQIVMEINCSLLIVNQE